MLLVILHSKHGPVKCTIFTI